MTEKQPSWREIARRLYVRLEHEDGACGHPEDQALPGDCPWCSTRVVLRMYEAKAGGKPPDPLAGAKSVPLAEIPVNQHMRLPGLP